MNKNCAYGMSDYMHDFDLTPEKNRWFGMGRTVSSKLNSNLFAQHELLLLYKTTMEAQTM